MNAQTTSPLAKFSSVFLRFALGISFLSAVADRFGLCGAYGQPNIAWGNYSRFVDYTAKLNPCLPLALIPGLAALSTAALAMTVALGVKAPLNYSVFSAAGGALLLGTCEKFPFSLDGFLARGQIREVGCP
ncbi:MAG TPA: hypothetical protein VFI45_01875 [Candidatus Acidoferrum sp.]|nr:hypothetical protein [Candidatus Acidoferrum sp.]